MIGMRSAVAAPGIVRPRPLLAALPLCRRRRAAAAVRVRASAGNVAPELRKEIEDLLAQHRIVLFMKGTKSFPMCGFSGTCVQILRAVSVNGAETPFHTVNVLEREDLRSGMKEYSQWPTFPQVYIDGEFFGGCDIMLDAYQSGELQETIERVMAA